MHYIPIKHKSNRRGIQLLETSAAIAVATLCMAVAVSLYGVTTRTERALGDREEVIRVTNNLLERTESLPFDSLDVETIFGLHENHLLQVIPAVSRVEVQVLTPKDEPNPSGPAERQITVKVLLENDDRPIEPVELSTWRYKHLEAKPPIEETN